MKLKLRVKQKLGGGICELEAEAIMLPMTCLCRELRQH